jgi:hypothetical protein
VFFQLKLYFGMSHASVDLRQGLPTQRGKKPTFDCWRLLNLLLVLSQNQESFLREISSFALIFGKAKTKPANIGVVV